MEKYISKTLQLLIKQTLKDIEIIAVNDYSEDKTYDILKKFALKDKRIKIINNTKNYGLLYSRAMGIIHSSGKYLINLDPDDELNALDNLEYLYNKAITTNVDIISYGYLIKRRKIINNLCDEFDVIIKQPKLFEIEYKYENSTKDRLIWNKLIKRELFLKAFLLFKEYIYYKKWNYHEDNIWSLLVHKLAKSKLCVKKLIYIYNNNINNMSLMRKRGSLIECNNIIYRFEMKRKILNKPVYFNYLRKECYTFFNTIQKSINFKLFIRTNNDLKKKAINILEICIKNYKISNIKKKKIINLINNF